MPLLERIDEDLKKALKGGDRDAATTLRGLKSDIKYYQIDKRLEKVSDEDVVVVLKSASRRRVDSIEQFRLGHRDDLVAKETRELEIIKGYLPPDLSSQELEELVRAAIAEAQAKVPADLGKVMKILMPKVQGRADGKIVKETVQRLLSA